MSYIENTLMSDEKIIFGTKPHWIIFSPSVTWLIASLLVLVFGPELGLQSTIIFGHKIYAIASLLAVCIAVYYAISAYINYISSEYAITDKRVLMKTGLIQRRSMEVFLSKIESISASQSVVGRILQYGTITISGTGGSKDPFNYIPNPLEFRRKVQEEVEKTNPAQPNNKQ